VTNGAAARPSRRRRQGRKAKGEKGKEAEISRGFLFFLFFSRFLQKYIFDMEIYRNIPRPPGCRAAGAYLKKRGKQIADRSLETGRPAAGRPAPKAARLRGGRHFFFLQFSPFREIISHICYFSNFLQK